MGDNPANFRAVSLHLSRTLDEIGLNTLTVKRRRRTFLYNEEVGNVYCRFTENNCIVYHFGSQTEGATTPGLNSDIDTLICNISYNIIQDWAEWGLRKVNLLMLQEETAPGYCRLQLLRSEAPMAREDVPNVHCTRDNSRRVIVKNTVLHKPVPGVINVRNGPAKSTESKPGFIDADYVYAFNYSSWPRQAEEFIRRRRRYGWPSQNLIAQATSHGVFLVPVGYKLSPTQDLEWRISASLAERCLMFSLNFVQIKCYVVLKMLVKTFVEPHIQKCISSYHCKTAVLNCIENTEPVFWRDDNLLQCVLRCLALLRTWVTDGFCPHFIISDENLFAGKVSVQNRGELLSILKTMIEGNGRILLDVRIDDFGEKLRNKFSIEPSAIPIIESLGTINVIGSIASRKHEITSNFALPIMLHYKTTQPVAVIHSVLQKIRILEDISGQANKHEREAIAWFSGFLSCWLGSLIVSVSLSHNIDIPRKAIQLIVTQAKYDIASILKLSSALYCSGEWGKSEMLLKSLEGHFYRNAIYLVCQCMFSPNKPTLEFLHMMSLLKGKRTRAQYFAHCVKFSPQEIHYVPPALRQEFFRSVGGDVHQRQPLDDWMIMAVVDCLPYMYYLQYITYSKLGKQDMQAQSLNNLKRCVKHENDFTHLETDWNLLGQCMELEQQPDAAMACYRTSLEIRPRDNAAHLHVQKLCQNRQRHQLLEDMHEATRSVKGLKK